MTNLLNHKNSLRKLKEEIDRAKRIDYPLSVAMMNFDNYKTVNDTADSLFIRIQHQVDEAKDKGKNRVEVFQFNKDKKSAAIN